MGAVFVKILNMSITAGWIVLAVLLVRLLLKKKAPKALFPILWALVAVRLVCPVVLESKISLIPNAEPVVKEVLNGSQSDKAEPIVPPPSHIGINDPEKARKFEEEYRQYIQDLEKGPEKTVISVVSGPFQQENPEEVDYFIDRIDPEDSPLSTEIMTELEAHGTYTETTDEGVTNTYTLVHEKTVTEQKKSVFEILAIVWLTGTGLMLLYMLVSYLRIYRKVKESAPLEDNIRMCDGIESPFLLGFVRPKIYLPSDLLEQDKGYVIAHEKAHMKRLDYLWKPLGFLLLTVYWFHPLLWVSYIFLCKDIEYACDEKVIKALGINQKKPYSEALINCSVSKKMISACPLAFGENGVKGRIKSILHYKKPAFWILVLSVAACVVVAICFLTNPKKEKEETGEPTPAVTGTASEPTDTEKNPVDLKAGDIISFGSYEQDNVSENGIEPISWMVLDVFDGKATLLSRYCLDAKPYHSEMESVTWENCALRSWLNKEFYNTAFSENDKQHILTTKLENPNTNSYGYDTEGGANTEDKVYLLSIEEVKQNFATGHDGYSEGARYYYTDSSTTATDYAKAQGVWEANYNGKTGCAWLLRTPGSSSDRVTRVGSAGSFDYDAEVNYGGAGVRPVIRITLTGAEYELLEASEEIADGTPLTRTARWKEVVPLSEAKAGYLVEFGSYEQDNEAGNGPEAIEWYVMDIKNGRALLLSRHCLESLPYHERREPVTWESCTLRSWLNNEFYQYAFTDEEKKRVVSTLLEDVWNPWNPNATYEYTEDKVFLLSMEEAFNGEYSSDINFPENVSYRFDGYFINDMERRAKFTAYLLNSDEAGGSSGWWLRVNASNSFVPSLDSVQEVSYNVPMVEYNGGISTFYGGMVEYEQGVRPAIWVELNELPDKNIETDEKQTPGSSGLTDGATLAERLPERYSYEEVQRVFLEYLNHQAYLDPAGYPQQAYDCVYEVYVTTESKMKRVYIKTTIKGKEAWFLCNPDIYLDMNAPLSVSRISNETVKYLLADNAIHYLGTDTIPVPAVTKPTYHQGNDIDFSQYKDSIGLIYERLCENGYVQKSGYEDVLKLEVWISEFSMEKKLYPHAYLVINGNSVYETSFTEYEGLYQHFMADNYTKQEPIEDPNGNLLSVGDVFDGRDIKPLLSVDTAKLERVKSSAVLHYVLEGDFTETIELNGENLRIPKQNITVNEDLQVGIAFVPQYTFSHVTHYNIYRSEDGGKNWRLIAEDYKETAGDISTILIPTPKHVVCYFELNGVTVQSSCILSEDGGATWSSPPQAAKPNSLLNDPDIGSSVVFGSYEQDGNSKNGTEPLEWIVLDRAGDKALLLTKYTLANYDFYNKYSSFSWEHSSIRRWLHEYFYVNAFSKEERESILKTKNDNPPNPYTGVEGGNATEDFVFLLSMDEVLYGKASDGKPYFRDDIFRVTIPTAAALNFAYSPWLKERDEATPEERWNGVTTDWWLRTPGGTKTRVATVTKEGTISVPGEEGGLYFVVGIRPAVWVDVSKLNP